MCGRAYQLGSVVTSGLQALNGGTSNTTKNTNTNTSTFKNNQLLSSGYPVDNNSLTPGDTAHIIIKSQTPVDVDTSSSSAFEVCEASFGFLRPGSRSDPIPLHKNGTRAFKTAQFNCRTEELAQVFVPCLEKNNTAIVPLVGWYEWLTESKLDGGKKQPYLAKLPNEQPVFFAALFRDTLRGVEEGIGEKETIRTFSLLTKSSSETKTKSLAWLHSRMPVILSSSQAKSWLTDGSTSFGGLSAMANAVDESSIITHPVTKKIGSTSYRGEDAHVAIKLEKDKTRSIMNFRSSTQSSPNKFKSAFVPTKSSKKSPVKKNQPGPKNFFAKKSKQT